MNCELQFDDGASELSWPRVSVYDANVLVERLKAFTRGDHNGGRRRCAVAAADQPLAPPARSVE
jgi:hypothetical protein